MALFKRKITSEDTEGSDDVVDLTDSSGPGACPNCGGPGYLDAIDLNHRVQHCHCKLCSHTWDRPIPDEGEIFDPNALEVVKPEDPEWVRGNHYS